MVLVDRPSWEASGVGRIKAEAALFGLSQEALWQMRLRLAPACHTFHSPRGGSKARPDDEGSSRLLRLLPRNTTYEPDSMEDRSSMAHIAFHIFTCCCLVGSIVNLAVIIHLHTV